MVRTKRSLYLLALSYLAFISLGLPDAVLGSAWPEMRHDFARPLESGGVLLSLTTVVSVGSSLCAGFVARRLHTGAIIAICCLLTACAMFGYATAGLWPVLVACTLLFGIGQGAVDSAVNAFMAGHYSARHMNWCHCCWGIGATAGPLVMGLALGSSAGWRGGYAAIGIAQCCLGIVFLLTLGLWKNPPAGNADEVETERHNPRREQEKPLTRKAVLPSAASGALFYFVYPGVEVMAGLWGASYMVDHLGAAPALAGLVTALFWASLTAGHLGTGFIAGWAGNTAIIRAGIAIALSGGLALVLSSGIPGCAAGLVILGLGIAPLYPTMMHDTPRRVGIAFADRQIGFQVGAALAGAAVLPLLAGLLMRKATLAVFGPVLLLSILLVCAAHELSLRFARLPR